MFKKILVCTEICCLVYIYCMKFDLSLASVFERLLQESWVEAGFWTQAADGRSWSSASGTRCIDSAVWIWHPGLLHVRKCCIWFSFHWQYECWIIKNIVSVTVPWTFVNVLCPWQAVCFRWFIMQSLFFRRFMLRWCKKVTPSVCACWIDRWSESLQQIYRIRSGFRILRLGRLWKCLDLWFYIFTFKLKEHAAYSSDCVGQRLILVAFWCHMMKFRFGRLLKLDIKPNWIDWKISSSNSSSNWLDSSPSLKLKLSLSRLHRTTLMRLATRRKKSFFSWRSRVLERNL